MRINVDMNQLIQNASFVQNQAEEYAEVYHRVYQLLQQMEGYWKGKDFLAFSTQLQSFRSDFELMKKILIEYASYLVKARRYMPVFKMNVPRWPAVCVVRKEGRYGQCIDQRQ